MVARRLFLLIPLLSLASSCSAPPPVYVGAPGTTATSVKVTVTGADWTVPPLKKLTSTVTLNGSDPATQDLVEQEPITLPYTYFILIDELRYPLILPSGRAGDVEIRVDAVEDGADRPEWSKYVVATVVSGAVTSVEVRLGPTCEDSEDCADKDTNNAPCDGFPVCVSGTCEIQPSCPAPNVPCVDSVQCHDDNGRPLCEYRANNSLCGSIPGLDGGTDATYCDPTRGCVRGEPCDKDTDCAEIPCQDRFCVGGTCQYELARLFEDHNDCTFDICPLSEGKPRHTPLDPGTACVLDGGGPGICRDDASCRMAFCGDGITTEAAGEGAEDEGTLHDFNPHDGIHECQPVRYDPRLVARLKSVQAMALDAQPVSVAAQWVAGGGLRLYVALDDGRLLYFNDSDDSTRWVAGSPVPGKVGSKAHAPRGQAFGSVIDMTVSVEGVLYILHELNGQLYLSTFKDGQITRMPRSEVGATSISVQQDRIFIGARDGVIQSDPQGTLSWPSLRNVKNLAKASFAIAALGEVPVDGGMAPAVMTLITGVSPPVYYTEPIPADVCTTPRSFVTLGRRVGGSGEPRNAIPSILLACDDGTWWVKPPEGMWAPLTGVGELIAMDSVPELRMGGPSQDNDRAFAIVRAGAGGVVLSEIKDTGADPPIFQTAPLPDDTIASSVGLRCPSEVTLSGGHTWVLDSNGTRVLRVSGGAVRELAEVPAPVVTVLKSGNGVVLVGNGVLQERSGAGVVGAEVSLAGVVGVDDQVLDATRTNDSTWLLLQGTGGTRLKQVDAPMTEVPIMDAPLDLTSAGTTLYLLAHDGMNVVVRTYDEDGVPVASVNAPGGVALVDIQPGPSAPAVLRSPDSANDWQIDCAVLSSACTGITVPIMTGLTARGAVMGDALTHFAVSDSRCAPGSGQLVVGDGMTPPILETGLSEPAGPWGLSSPVGVAWDEQGLWVSDVGLDMLAMVSRGADGGMLAAHYGWLGSDVLPGPMGMTRTVDGGLLVALHEANTVTAAQYAEGAISMGPRVLGNGMRVSTYAQSCIPRSSAPTAPVGMSQENGSLYIAEYADHTVVRLVPGSPMLRPSGVGRDCLPGTTITQLANPRAVVMREGVMITADTENNRLIRHQGLFTDGGALPPEMLLGPNPNVPFSSPIYRPSALEVDSNDNVWVATSNAVYILEEALHRSVPDGGFEPLLAYDAVEDSAAGETPCLAGLALEPGCGPRCRIYVADACRGVVVELTHRWEGDGQ